MRVYLVQHLTTIPQNLHFTLWHVQASLRDDLCKQFGSR